MPVSLPDAAEIEFPQGLPGFEQERRFLLVEPEALKPLILLQSASSSLCFTTLPLAAIDAHYDFHLSTEDLAVLGGTDSVLGLAILCHGENGVLTANLLAPIAIHLANRVGVQAVRFDTRYSHAQPVGEAVVCS